MSDKFAIGGLAQAAGVHVETIRFYQRRGLLEEPAKPPGGQRRYTSAGALRVRVVKGAQPPGFQPRAVNGLLLP